MFKLFSDKYTTREVFSDEELALLAQTKSYTQLVEGCLCVLMLSPEKLQSVLARKDPAVVRDLLPLLLKRVILAHRLYHGAVRTLIALGAPVDYGELVSDLRIWASDHASLDLLGEFPDRPPAAHAFLRAAVINRHETAARDLFAEVSPPDLETEKTFAARFGLHLS